MAHVVPDGISLIFANIIFASSETVPDNSFLRTLKGTMISIITQAIGQELCRGDSSTAEAVPMALVIAGVDLRFLAVVKVAIFPEVVGYPTFVNFASVVQRTLLKAAISHYRQGPGNGIPS